MNGMWSRGRRDWSRGWVRRRVMISAMTMSRTSITRSRPGSVFVSEIVILIKACEQGIAQSNPNPLQIYDWQSKSKSTFLIVLSITNQSNKTDFNPDWSIDQSNLAIPRKRKFIFQKKLDWHHNYVKSKDFEKKFVLHFIIFWEIIHYIIDWPGGDMTKFKVFIIIFIFTFIIISEISRW